MLQVPNLPNYQMAQPSYNAVKIDIHNPSVSTGATCPVQPQPVQYGQGQYEQPTAPYYNYPQTQLYNYPQVANQPYYMPQQPVYVPQQPVYQPQQPVYAPQAQVICPPCPPCPQQVNINEAPQAPAPMATQPVNNPEVAVEQPANDVQPLVDLNAFIANLTNPDYEVQANAMEKIANMVKDEPAKATELLDTKIIDELVKIVNTDSSKLAGPTQEQIAARQKLMSGKEITDQEKALATTITPMEQAERNKSYAMFTAAILEKLYADEVNKLTGSTVPLTELPAALNIVDQLKDNPNPMVRTSAIEALSYIQRPEYKKDLNTLFTIAQNDVDVNVQEAAKAALDKLNQV